MTKLEALAASPPIDFGVALFTGAFGAQILSAWSASNGSGEQIIWLPGGLLLAALVRLPEPRWPAAVFAAASGAGIAAALSGPSLVDAALVVATLLILVPATAHVFGRLCAEPPVLHAFRNLAWFFMAFLFGLPVLSAAMFAAFHYADDLRGHALLHCANDALAQSLGYLALLPLWVRPAISPFRRRRITVPKMSSLAIALLATAVIGLFWNRFGPVGYLRPLLILAPVPFLTFIALRAGFIGTHAFMVLMAAIALALSLAARGPFIEADDLSTMISVKSWVLAMSTATWLLAFVVEQRVTMRRALVDSNREVRELAGKLIQAQEQERSRIARDLHDDVNQRLASASIELSALRRTVDDKTRLGLDHLQNELIALSEDVRHISHNLHPSMLRETGLKAALGSLCNSQRHRNGPAIDLHVAAQRDELPDVVALCLYRATQEALGNAIRHAGARHIEVRLRIGEREAELTVGDDGRGFSTGGNRAMPRGLGLLSLEERAKLLEGTFRLDAAPGKGVRVCLTIPLQH